MYNETFVSKMIHYVEWYFKLSSLFSSSYSLKTARQGIYLLTNIR